MPATAMAPFPATQASGLAVSDGRGQSHNAGGMVLASESYRRMAPEEIAAAVWAAGYTE